MYTYFTREQLIAFVQTILPDFTESQLEEWEQSAPSILQPLPPIFAMLQTTHLVINGHWTPASIHAIHIHRNHATYDLDILLPEGERHRMYNISPALIARDREKKPESERPELPEQVNLVNKMFSDLK